MSKKFMLEKSFLQNTNNNCSCGKHEGIGDFTPHERAQCYNWFRSRDKREWHVNDGGMKSFLESYEMHHGKLDSESFVFNDSRWKDQENVRKARGSTSYPQNNFAKEERISTEKVHYYEAPQNHQWEESL